LKESYDKSRQCVKKLRLKGMFLEGGDCHCFILRVLVTGMRWDHVDEDRRLSLGDLERKTKGITGVAQALCQ